MEAVEEDQTTMKNPPTSSANLFPHNQQNQTHKEGKALSIKTDQ